MNYVVFDMEWNQALGPSLRVTEPILLHGDIIEIGAVKMDENFRQIDTYRAFIRPEFYIKMHRKIGNLTHINPRMLEKSPPFAEVYKEFMQWCGDDFRFMSWGPNDLPMLVDNLIIRGISPDDLPDAIDVQEIFAEKIMRDNRCYSLSKAVKIMNLPLAAAHDALNDAINTARIMDCMDMEDAVYWYDHPLEDDFEIDDAVCFA